MNLKGLLSFDVKLKATIPDSMGVLNIDEILKRGGDLIKPKLHMALVGALSQLSVIGIKIEIVSSTVELKRADD